MRARHSVRAYAGVPLTNAEREALNEAAVQARSPFGPKDDVSITIADFDLSGPQRPGTYGVITGATTYMLMGFADTPDARLSAGFIFEQIVLRATELGLGTCWIAATFRSSDFSAKADFPAGRSLNIISPVGAAASHRTIRDRITRFIARSDRRLPVESLFFQHDFATPLDSDNDFAESLAMMRIAPSSMNSQPWRALVADDGAVHFYSAPSSKMARLDCGIGLCHFALAEEAQGVSGSFYIDPDRPDHSGDLSYLRSYRRNP